MDDLPTMQPMSASEMEQAPRLTLDEDDLKEVKDWKVGETYYLVIAVKEIGSHVKQYGQEAGKIESHFAVTSVKPLRKRNKYTKSLNQM